MQDIPTTGGLFTEEIRKTICDNICRVFYCNPEDIKDLKPLQVGLTNIILSFEINGHKYVYRHPGLGSEILVERGRETIMQKIVDEAGIDTTLVAMDVLEGWRISRYVEHWNFDYKNPDDMERAVKLFRKLHDAPCRVRWTFDEIKKAEEIKAQIAPHKYGRFPDFEKIRERICLLVEEAKKDHISKCNIHGDARDENFLINEDEIHLIDWEYGGYGDPGMDIGSYICGGQHTLEEVDRILSIYCGGTPDLKQKRHFYAYIAITAWFFMHWAMLKQSKGQRVGILKEQWYHYAKDFSIISLPLYGITVDSDQYKSALDAAEECRLDDLEFMNQGIEL